LIRYRQRIKQHPLRQAFWRLVFSGRFTYSEVAAMDFDEFFEALAALELFTSKQEPGAPKVPKVRLPRRR